MTIRNTNTISPVAPTANGVEAGCRRGPGVPDSARGRAEPTEGPRVLRNAWLGAIDDMATAFERGLGPKEDWTTEACAARLKSQSNDCAQQVIGLVRVIEIGARRDHG
jgi:hypothetical protein